MNKTVLFLSLAFSSVLTFGSANAQIGKVTRLMTKDLPDVPGKEGMVEIVEFAPGEVSQPHRHNADLFVYVLEGSVITQVKGGNSETVHAGGVFYESPTDVHIVSRNASVAGRMMSTCKKSMTAISGFKKTGTPGGNSECFTYPPAPCCRIPFTT